MKYFDLVGKKINRLTIVGVAGRSESRHIMLECRCDCGNTVFTRGVSLLSGRTRSCGCIRAEQAAKLNRRHGGGGTRLYRIWTNMRDRCNNANTPAYSDYGGRGICISDEWNDFEHFRAWALAHGYGDTLTIDRIDVNGNYCPENCRWVTQMDQCNNKRSNRLLTHNGETLTIAEWARRLNVNYFSLHDRITRLGWSAEKALTTPIKETGR